MKSKETSSQVAARRATLPFQNLELMQNVSMHTENLKQSPAPSSRKQFSTRESIQERFKLASMNLTSPKTNQLGPIQGHSMQLVQHSERSPRVQTHSNLAKQHQETQNEPDHDTKSIIEYQAIMMPVAISNDEVTQVD